MISTEIMPPVCQQCCMLSVKLFLSKTFLDSRVHVRKSTGSSFTSIRKKVADFKRSDLKGYIKKKKKKRGSGTIGNAISYSAYPDGIKHRQKFYVSANPGVQPCTYYAFGLTTEMALYAWGVENLE